MGERVGVGVSTQVPLFSVCPLGQVQTGPLGLSRHSHSHFFLSHGLFTKITDRERVIHRHGPLYIQPWGSLLTLRLLVAMVQNYVGGMIHPGGQVLSWASPELVHPEHVVVDVGDAVDVVFKHIDAEGLMELWGSSERTRYREEAEELLGWEKGGVETLNCS